MKAHSESEKDIFLWWSYSYSYNKVYFMNEEHFYVLTQMEKQNKKNDQRLKLHMKPKIRDQGLTTMY